jgi:hypothetical protein
MITVRGHTYKDLAYISDFVNLIIRKSVKQNGSAIKRAYINKQIIDKRRENNLTKINF